MEPIITKSELSRPPRWYVVTRYKVKEKVGATTGEKKSFIVASKKYDVTEQIERILKTERK